MHSSPRRRPVVQGLVILSLNTATLRRRQSRLRQIHKSIRARGHRARCAGGRRTGCDWRPMVADKFLVPGAVSDRDRLTTTATTIDYSGASPARSIGCAHIRGSVRPAPAQPALGSRGNSSMSSRGARLDATECCSTVLEADPCLPGRPQACCSGAGAQACVRGVLRSPGPLQRPNFALAASGALQEKTMAKPGFAASTFEKP